MIQAYLKGVLEIVDTMLAYPGLWWGLLLENRVLTSSLLQDSLCHGAVMLATYQESSTTDFSLDSLREFTRKGEGERDRQTLRYLSILRRERKGNYTKL